VAIFRASIRHEGAEILVALGDLGYPFGAFSIFCLSDCFSKPSLSILFDQPQQIEVF
jgi:hypothetical protein